MQNRAFNLRWTPAALAIAATVGFSVTAPANAASTLSNPVAAAIASAGGGSVTSQPGTGQAAQPVAGTPAATNGTSTVPGAPPVEAAQPSRPTDAPELAALQSQLALWKARAEIAKFKAEVKRAEDSMVAAPAGVPPGAGVPSVSLGGPMPTGGVAERAPRLAPEAPRLVSLRAFDGHYNAVVDVSGRTVPVQAGDSLEGGWKVVSIDDGGVKLANGKRVRTLRP
ncbi:type IV pilus biogenesis protein PilP [Cupriavidus sp. IK-TO18]|uniref:type IV pilus biogenesis protein PilP n=1 Tax=Cupriavidus sp. IK-TO18 TaxID=2782182 RepID=UPI001C55121F|nr:type IV pilus biogenesis protein PilP [Cupriavidus sp. IK-TO18]